ncbi:MAG: PDZ domain-containing protein [Armatimonadetes bacterium]|nr:PDZ domain-containing protein [Armatimonadota bacterium]
MRFWQKFGLALLASALLAAPAVAQQESEARAEEKGVHAEVTGWFYGMYLGENQGAPFPFVLEVDPQGAARRAGVRRGDEILRFQDQEVRSLRELHREMSRLKPGDRVKLTIRRSAQTLMFEFTVPENPTAQPQAKTARKERDHAKSATPKKKSRKPPIVLKPLPPREER